MGRVVRSATFWLTLGSLAGMTAVAWRVGLAAGTSVDGAAHAYKLAVLRAGGPFVWDAFWYCGTYGPIAYGPLYYGLARFTGETLPVVVAAGAIAPLFHVYVRRAWGIAGVLPAVALAGLVALELPLGQDPFLVGCALMVLALALLAYRLQVAAAFAVAAALFVNPVAVLVVGVFLVADVAVEPQRRRRYLRFAVALAPFAVARLVLLLAFAEPGEEVRPFWAGLKYVALGLGGALLARSSRDPGRRAREAVFLTAAVVCALSMLVPGNPVGATVGRWFALFAIPAVLCIRGLRRPLTVAAVAVVVAVQVPIGTVDTYYVHPGPTQRQWQAYFAPALEVAAGLNDPDYRVHVLTTDRHWESYFFPLAGYPIARGWYRQSDVLHNGVLGEEYGAAEYAAWLREVGVRHVFVPHAHLPPSSRREAEVLAGGPPFAVAAETADWTVYELADAQPLVVPAGPDGRAAAAVTTPGPAAGSSGPAGPDGRASAAEPGARVLRYGRDALVLAVERPGDYVIKVTWTPYWSLARGAGTLAPAPGRWTLLHAQGDGGYELRIEVTAGRVLRAVF